MFSPIRPSYETGRDIQGSQRKASFAEKKSLNLGKKTRVFPELPKKPSFLSLKGKLAVQKLEVHWGQNSITPVLFGFTEEIVNAIQHIQISW